MEVIKKIFKTKGSRIWFIVTACVLAFLLVLSILANTLLYNLIITTPLGSGSAITADGTEQLYTADFETKEDAKRNSNEVSERIVEEGIVLLKNDNNALPLAENSRISVFGKNSVDIVIGGSGSGGASDTSSVKSLYDSLEAAGFVCNPALKSFYQNNTQSGDGRPNNPSMESGGTPTLHTGETPWSSYVANNVPASYASDYKDAALIVLSRIGGEGWDLPRTMGSASGARNADDHYLQPDANETALIREVCSAGFDKVIIIINVSTTMELGFWDDPGHYAYNANIDAALWLGAPGESGVMALGRILKGEVTPSGRTPDTYVRDFKADPTWQNFGDYLSDRGNYYSGISSVKGGYTYTFVDYEESIYIGYRYWETRAFVEGDQAYTGEIHNTSTTSWEDWYKAHVVYPFGYGLSYTSFKQEIVDMPEGALTKDKINLKVKVTNIGNYDGKETVQLYVTAPVSENIEKSHVVLAAFGKTELLQAGREEEVALEIDPYDFASWDSTRVHDGQTGAYVLEAGTYTFRIMSNAHDEIDSFSLELAQDIVYDKDPVTNTVLKNRFDDADDELRQLLSRKDFDGTFPQPRTTEEKVAGALSSDLEDRIESRPIPLAFRSRSIPIWICRTSLRSAIWWRRFSRRALGNAYRQSFPQRYDKSCHFWCLQNDRYP